DQAARDEERADPARPLLLQRDRGFLDAGKATDAGADQHAGALAFGLAFRLPAGILDRLLRRSQAEDDEVIHPALLFRLDPLVGIEGAVLAAAARHIAGDLGRQVGDVELLDAAGAGLAVEQALPIDLDAASQRRDQPHPGDYHTPHRRLLLP